MNIGTYFILAAIGGYLLGSIPFGLVLTKICGLGDIRKIGSGNIGATNVLRTGRKDLALLTVILDASKAGIAALIAQAYAPEGFCSILGFISTVPVVSGLIAGVMGVIGHNFPVWLKFKGGKGVASGFGFIVATQAQLGLIALGVWLITAFTTRYSSLSAILACLSVPVFAFFLSDPVHAIFYSAIALLVLIRHHTNIVRLCKGTESKISFKKK